MYQIIDGKALAKKITEKQQKENEKHKERRKLSK